MNFKTLFRIPAWFGLEGTHKDLVHPPCPEQGRASPGQVAQSPIQLDLEHAQWWGSWQLLQAIQREAALLKGCSKASLKPFFSRLNTHKSLSLSSWEIGSSPLIILVVSSGLTPADPICLVQGSPRTGQSALSGVSQKQRRGWELSPSACCPHLFWCSPGNYLLSGLQAHIASSCPIFSLLESQSLPL